MTTSDGLTVYDLDTTGTEVFAVAGPAGVDHATIDPSNLPPGFRWVEGAEWARLAWADAIKQPSPVE